MSLEKKQKIALLKDMGVEEHNGVKAHHFTADDKIDVMFDEVLAERGYSEKDGKLFKSLTEEDLEMNPPLKELGFVVGDEVGLGELNSKLKEESDGKDKDQSPTSPPSSEALKSGKNQGSGEVKVTMLRQVKHNNILYKKDVVVSVENKVAELFIDKKWAK